MTDALPASGAGEDDDARGGNLLSFCRRLDALSLDRPPRAPVLPPVIDIAQPPAERKLAVRTRRVMLSLSEIAVLDKYRRQ